MFPCSLKEIFKLPPSPCSQKYQLQFSYIAEKLYFVLHEYPVFGKHFTWC